MSNINKPSNKPSIDSAPAESAANSQGFARDAHGNVIIDEKARSASRKKLMLIFAMFFVPLLLATIWLQLVKSGDGKWGNTSRGELITPAAPFAEFSLAEKDQAEPFVLDDVRGKWTVLYVPAGNCAEQCEQTLHNIRQARLALNHRMERVQRVVAVGSLDALNQQLLEKHVGLRVVSGAQDQLAGFLAQITDAQKQMDAKDGLIYLIDPMGNLMMRYTPDLLPRPLFKDLKHLLKVSRIG